MSASGKRRNFPVPFAVYPNPFYSTVPTSLVLTIAAVVGVAAAAVPSVTAAAAAYATTAQLTEKGMQQALKLGEFVRKTYVENLAFLPPTLGSGGSGGTYSSSFMSDSGESPRVLMDNIPNLRKSTFFGSLNRHHF